MPDTAPPPLTNYECFALHCMPRLQSQDLVSKLITYGTYTRTTVPARRLTSLLSELQSRGAYIHWCHTSPRQHRNDANALDQTLAPHYTVSRRVYGIHNIALVSREYNTPHYL